MPDEPSYQNYSALELAYLLCFRVEAFHELPDRLYINAETCIDCDACVPECPVEAIFADTSVPEQYASWTQINIDEAPNYPVISQKIPALHGEKCSGPPE